MQFHNIYVLLRTLWNPNNWYDATWDKTGKFKSLAHCVSLHREENKCFLDCVNDGGAFVVSRSSMCRQWMYVGKTNASRTLRVYCFNGGGETRRVHLRNGCLLAGSPQARAELCTSVHSVLRCVSRAPTPPNCVAPHQSQTPCAASWHPFLPAGVQSRVRTPTNRARESYET